jgi:hypothetical protein
VRIDATTVLHLFRLARKIILKCVMGKAHCTIIEQARVMREDYRGNASVARAAKKNYSRDR